MRFSTRCQLSVAVVLLLAGALGACSALTFIEDRLDPPKSGVDGMTFRYKAPAARQVNVAGEFNNWLGTGNGQRLDPNIDSMQDLDEDGIWEITLPLPPGRYQYKFVIDQVDWQEDPANPETIDDGFGGLNSILVVSSSVDYVYDESYVSRSLDTGSRSQRVAPHEFVLKGYDQAKNVFVTGDFSNWDPSGVAMDLSGDGTWRVTVELREGEHPYKFVVDGEWIADPGNAESMDDGYGGTNSLARVRP